MSAGQAPTDFADRERLAAEHVIGLLEGEERREAERLVDADVAFRELVAQWQARFSELDQTASPVAPSEALWSRIEAGLAASPAAAIPQSAPPLIVPNPASAFSALWRSLAFWRTAGLAGAFATLLMAFGVGMLANRAGREPVLVAVLLTSQNQPAAVVNAFADGRAELVPFEGFQIPAGRALEVWAIPGPNQNPISVGVVREARSLALDLARLPGLRSNQTIAISVEPPGGSPTGQPTGDVILTGRATTAL